MLSCIEVLAAGPVPAYHWGCSGTFIPTTALRPINIAETNEITRVTGIRIMELIAPAKSPMWAETFAPAQDQQQKIAFAKKMSAFIKTFPVGFLRKNADMCLVLINKFQSYGAITFGNVALLPTDVPLSTIAHEMMHAIDSLQIALSNPSSWNELNASGKCEYKKNENMSVASFGLIDINECFVSTYGQSEAGEDRAELFAAMVQDYYNLIELIPADSALQKKLDSVKAFLKSQSPDIDDEYWKNRSSHNDDNLYNSCGASNMRDSGCRFDRVDPFNDQTWIGQ